MRNRLSIFCLLLAVASAAFATDFAVVVHPANPVRAMTLTELGKIFKGKSSMWPTGRNITVVLRDPDSPAMRFVVEKVMGVAVDQARAILSDPNRKSSTPVVFAESDAEIVNFVAGNSSAIGIIDVYNITGRVKVVKIDDKQPFDPGYVLKAH